VAAAPGGRHELRRPCDTRCDAARRARRRWIRAYVTSGGPLVTTRVAVSARCVSAAAAATSRSASSMARLTRAAFRPRFTHRSMAALSGSCSGDGGERPRSSADAAASTLANIGRAQRSRRCCVGVPILRRAQNGYVAQDVMRPYSDNAGAVRSLLLHRALALSDSARPSRCRMVPGRPSQRRSALASPASNLGDAPLDHHQDDRQAPTVALIEHAATTCDKLGVPAVLA
jgi:hypothetical protein